MRTTTFGSTAVLAVLLALSTRLGADDTPRKSIYQRTLRSAALIVAGRSQGTGWVVDAKRKLVVTNSHVVGSQESVTVTFPRFNGGQLVAERSAYRDRGPGIRGTVLDVDPRRDLALIELESLPNGVTELPMAKTAPSPGDPVHSVGNPASSDALWVYTSGTVRQVYRKKFAIDGQQVDARVVETQSPINPGDSGGPVLNDAGEVVGVTSATNRSAQLVSLCIDASEVRDFLASAAKVATPRTAIEFNRRGEQWLNKARYDKAIADFTKAIDLDADLAIAYFNRGVCFQSKNDFITALADFDTAIRLKPDYALAYRGRGVTYFRRGDLPKAMADVEEALRLNPNDAIAYNLRGVARTNKRQYDLALTDFAEAIRVDPTYAMPHYNRGDIYNAKNEYDKAIACFDEAIRLNPNLALAYRDRGMCYRLKNNLTAAQADYDKAVQLNPADPLAFRERALVHKARGKYDEAIADATQSLKLNPKDAISYNLRGASLSFKNDWEKAVADYTAAIQINPKYATAFNNRGHAYKALGEEGKSKADFEEAVRLDPAIKSPVSKMSDRPPETAPAVKPPETKDKSGTIAGVRFRAVHGYTSDKFQVWLNELLKTDFFPISISSYPIEGRPRFAAVAIDDGSNPGWQVHYNLDSAAYRKKFDEFKADNYRPSAVIGYPNGDATSFAGIWVKDGTQRNWYLMRNFTLEELHPAIDEQKEKGMRPVFLAGYPVGSSQRFAAIFHADKGESWISRYNMTNTDFQKSLDELQPKGYRPICVTGYPRGETTRFGCVFVKDVGVSWAIRYNLSSDALKAEFDKWTPKGYRPVSISGYFNGDELRYAAIWVKD